MSTIFWSWQSDLDARVTRDLIRDALAAAIAELGEELEERHELTSDTKGVSGSPDIVATILAKIDAAAVFVADVTPITVTSSGKAVANPNVLIELGYAKKSVGLTRIITVWNTAFAGATLDALPFDMRGRRGPLSFHASVGVSKAELGTARDGLKVDLKAALQACLRQFTPSPLPVPKWQEPSSVTPAIWFDPSVPLRINERSASGAKLAGPGPYAYMRIVAANWVRPSNFAQADHSHILGDTRGFSWGTTQGGFLTYSGSIFGETAPLERFTMQFRNTGELWGVDAVVSRRQDGVQLFFADYVIKSFHEFLADNLGYLKKQGATGPFSVRLGVTDLGQLQWVTETGWGGSPRALEPEAQFEFVVSDTKEEALLTALAPAWGEIANAFGVPEPDRPTLVRQIRGY